MRKAFLSVLAVALVMSVPTARAAGRVIGINVVLNTSVSPAILSDLGRFGRVLDTIEEINAVHMRAPQDQLPVIAAQPYVEAATPDAERQGAPVDTVPAADFASGISTWDQDAINVTDFGATPARVVGYDGTGVTVAVLDTGLLDSWRQYFPQQRIAAHLARAFVGGGSASAAVATTPNVWEHDQNSHGTHVTSTILGYQFGTRIINGTAPMATVIPVKVLNQNGSGWSSAIARGIVYVTDLKKNGTIAGPVVINMSLSGGALDAVEKAAIDYAVENGVIIVAAAGNRGTAGMGYPAAYAPVISVAASGWDGEWSVPGSWWRTLDVPDPLDPAHYYIADFSSRQRAGQDLDVAAPGTWVVGPYQVNSGNLRPTYYYLGGTSMSSPHVAGIVALMQQKKADLTAAEVETILENTAIPLAPGCLTVDGVEYCWGADATGHGLATADAALAAIP